MKPSASKWQDPEQHEPGLLRPLPRTPLWKAYGCQTSPFTHGMDVWFAWELSWLNPQGLPQVAVAELQFPGETPYLIESKSLKYYLCSLNHQHFCSREELIHTVGTALGKSVHMPVGITLYDVDEAPGPCPTTAAICLDKQDIATHIYDRDPALLQLCDTRVVEESLCSHLLRSHCPLTGQPDWASVYIGYRGKAIDHAALLRYIVSWRNHSGFAEHCTEHIFLDILQQCGPQRLHVCCRYLRRGGLDINPWRSNCGDCWGLPTRAVRQ